jgi:hypothetical protein
MYGENAGARGVIADGSSGYQRAKVEQNREKVVDTMTQNLAARVQRFEMSPDAVPSSTTPAR